MIWNIGREVTFHATMGPAQDRAIWFLDRDYTLLAESCKCAFATNCKLWQWVSDWLEKSGKNGKLDFLDSQQWRTWSVRTRVNGETMALSVSFSSEGRSSSAFLKPSKTIKSKTWLHAWMNFVLGKAWVWTSCPKKWARITFSSNIYILSSINNSKV